MIYNIDSDNICIASASDDFFHYFRQKLDKLRKLDTVLLLLHRISADSHF